MKRSILRLKDSGSILRNKISKKIRNKFKFSKVDSTKNSRIKFFCKGLAKGIVVGIGVLSIKSAIASANPGGEIGNKYIYSIQLYTINV